MANIYSNLTLERAHELFEYRDGDLIRKITTSNNAKAGQTVGCLASNGYLVVRINNVLHYVHRLVFFMHHGFFPAYVDHIDGNPANNRIGNLRQSTNQQNSCNQRIKKANKSGFKNVSWSKEKNKWVVRVQTFGQVVHVGYFENLKDAVDAAIISRNTIHHEFARHS